ncbi:hypothetical protein [Stigmatella hybrida]|uniref:hypothetical protein n=1 Tax=Stigmatella hybrida TaxID=394097 RepID=UPI001CDB1B55|nr:hypothetical protein [Stigmatella hybrida]
MGRNSRTKKSRRQATLTPGQELFKNVPHERKGDFLVPKQAFSPAAHQAAKEKFRQRAPLLQDLMKAKSAKLRTLLMPAPPLDLLAALSLEVFLVDMIQLRPALSGLPWVFVEYPTWIYLTSASTMWAQKGNLTRETIDSVLACEDELIGLLFEKTLAASLLKDDDEFSIQDEFLAHVRHQELLIRQPLHLHQLYEQHLMLFNAIQDPLRTMTGFDIHSAWSLYTGLTKLLSHRLALLQSSLPKKDDSLRVTINASLGKIRQLYEVTPTQLAEASRHSEDESRAFLNFFGLGLVQSPTGDNLPNIHEPLELSPLLNLGEDIWFIHLAPKLPLAFKPAFEKLLKKTDPRTWRTYERARGRYLEARTLELVSRRSPKAKAWSSLEYDFDEGLGKGTQRFELDGLLAIDTVLFLVEAKAGAVRLAARRGAPSAMDDLDSLVSEAYQQATRALQFIRSQPNAQFNLKNGTRINITKEQFTRVVLLTTTLDDLSAHVTRLGDLVKLGVLPQGPLPWAVALHDLEVMTELVDGMGQLIHYIERRHASTSVQLMASSEIELFSGYLMGGLRFEGTGDATVLVPILSQAIDDYYAHRSGLKKAHTARPQWGLAGPLLRLIQHLESGQPQGFIEAICALLELGPGERAQFMHEVGIRHRSAAKNGFSAFTYIKDNLVFAFASGRELSREILTEYTRSVKHVTRRERAIGIMQALDRPALIEVVLEFGAWKEDPQRQVTSMEVMRRYTV